MTRWCGWLLVLACAAGAQRKTVVERVDPKTVRGAVYVPYNAFNAPQLWAHYDPKETRRDFGYARRLHVNAVRVWASYEFWQKEPDRFKRELDDMLEAAHGSGIRVLLSLFENDGAEPTPENMWTTDPAKAFAIMSPGAGIAASSNHALWEAPRGFVTWFMKVYRNDNRLLAIEIMNEPSTGENPAKPDTVSFTKSMLQTAKSMQGTVALTVGTDSIAIAEQLVPYGLDVIQFHDNFPKSVETFGEKAKRALALGEKYHLPVWVTEWQRVRPSGSGWGDQKLTPTELEPDYASMAPAVRSYPIGEFFWCLMVKRAYLKPQRDKGTVQGIFFPDGTVLSEKDARAVANDPVLKVKVSPLPPDFRQYLKRVK